MTANATIAVPTLDETIAKFRAVLATANERIATCSIYAPSARVHGGGVTLQSHNFVVVSSLYNGRTVKIMQDGTNRIAIGVWPMCTKFTRRDADSIAADCNEEFGHKETLSVIPASQWWENELVAARQAKASYTALIASCEELAAATNA